MFHVYILRSLKNGRSYTGSTADIDRRLQEHNSGQCHATRFCRPFEIIFLETFPTRVEAVRREKYL